MVVMSDIVYSLGYDNGPCLQGCTATRGIGVLWRKDKGKREETEEKTALIQESDPVSVTYI